MSIFSNEYVLISAQIMYATLAGAVIGYERERLGKPAGVKTHSLLCLGSCLIMLIGELTFRITAMGDPMRMAAQVVSGVGFLCGGVIMVTKKNTIKGLTTAAGLWFAATMGLVIGSRFAWISIPAMLCFFFISHVLSIVDHNMRVKQRNEQESDNEKE